MNTETSTNQTPDEDELERILNLSNPFNRIPPEELQASSPIAPQSESTSTSEDEDDDEENAENNASSLNNNPESSPPKKRQPRGAYPPALTLEEAVSVIKSFYEDAGGEANYDALSKILNNSSASSTFGRKVAALRNYNLIIDENRELKLSETGYDIVAPREPAQRHRALKQAFLSIDVFDKIYLKFMGRILPQDEFLVNSFKDYVPREIAPDWLVSFKTSARFADLFIERDDGKYQVREGVGGEVKQAEKPPEDKKIEPEDTTGDKGQPPVVNPPVDVVPPTPKSYYEFLIEILSPDMEQAEQDAVWTLIRYLKEQEAKKRVSKT
jgi:hypothetical protein